MLKTRKIAILILTFILMITFTTVFATEEVTPEVTNEGEVTQETPAETTVETEEQVVEEVKNQEEVTYVKAKVLSVGEEYEEVHDDLVNMVQDIRVKILSGEHRDKAFDSKYTLSHDIDNKIMAYELEKGDTVFVQITQTGKEVTSVVTQELVREVNVIYIILTFFLLVFFVGGKKGIKAIISLVITVLVVYFVTVRFIFQGMSPIIASVMTCALTIFLTFIIIGGINKKTLTASLGTIGGIVVSGIMAMIFGGFAKLSGIQEEAVFLSISAGNIAFNFREILYAGIIIASLGACMDVGMSIASALDEIKQKNDDLEPIELLKSGINIGKDVIGTMTNTLILAYVGSSLNLILVFMANSIPVVEIINRETIVADIVSAIAGSMGVVCTIPMTSLIYVLLNKNNNKFRRKPTTRLDGERTLKI